MSLPQNGVPWVALTAAMLFGACTINQGALIPPRPHDGGADSGEHFDGAIADSRSPDVRDSSIVVPDTSFDATDAEDAGDAGVVPGFRSISAGGRRTCAITTGGRLFCWGKGTTGALGIGVAEDRDVPSQVGRATNWALVSVGSLHVCATTQDGALYCFGHGHDGRLGVGDSSNRLSPAQVGTARWLTVDAGDMHTCGVTFDHRLMCWGSNSRGQLGVASTGTSSNVPVQVGDLSGWVSVAAAWTHSCGYRSSGQIQCWGGNDAGQLGIGNWSDQATPTELSGSWQAVTAFGEFTCARSSDRSVFCWGTNGARALGLPAVGNQNVPTLVSTASLGTNLTSGRFHSCQQTDLDELQCWGGNSNGELGQGDVGGFRGMVVVPIAGVVKQSTGLGHTCAVDVTGILHCFGLNDYGQLGLGTVGGASGTPAAVAFP